MNACDQSLRLISVIFSSSWCFSYPLFFLMFTLSLAAFAAGRAVRDWGYDGEPGYRGRLNGQRFNPYRYEAENPNGGIAALLVGMPIALFVGQEYLANPPDYARSWNLPKVDSKNVAKNFKGVDLSLPNSFPTTGELRKRIKDAEKQSATPKPAPKPAASAPAPAAPKPAAAAPAPAPPKPAAPAPKKLTEAEILKQLDAVTIGYDTQQQYMDIYNTYMYQQGQQGLDSSQPQTRIPVPLEP